jgi:hypothetical protein
MNKKLPLLLISSALGVSLLAFNATKVNAQSGLLTVAPARQIIQVDPGETKTFNLKFLNQGTSPIAGTFGVADFIVMDKQGTPVFLDENEILSSRFAAATWVTLPFTRGTIAAEDRLTLQLTLNVPANAKPGGRYFGVFFEPSSAVPAETGFEYEAGTGVETRIAGLVYVRVSGPIEDNAAVTRFSTPKFAEYGPVPVTTEITNRGNYHIRPTGTLALYDMLGRKVDEKSLQEENIFPDATRVFENELGSKYMFGKFTAKLTAIYGESGKVLTATTSFWAFPVRLALLIILTIIILILVAIMIWKMMKGKQVKLEKKLEEEIHELEELKHKFSDKTPRS